MLSANLKARRRPVPGEIRGVNEGDALAMQPSGGKDSAAPKVTPTDVARARSAAKPVEQRIRELLANAETRPNGMTGGTQKAGEEVTLPRIWHSDADHPVAMLAYITPTEANILSKLDVHGSGVDKEAHFGPKGIQSFQGGGGTGDGGGNGGGGFWDMRDEPGIAGTPVGPAPSTPSEEGGKDEGARARDAARAGGIGGFNDSRTWGDRIGDWLSQQATNVGITARTAMNHPARTGINALTSLVPGLGLANTVSGLFGGPTVGGLATSAARAVTGYDQPADAISTPDGPPTDPNSDKGQTGGDGAATERPAYQPGMFGSNQPSAAQIAQDAIRRAIIYKPGAYNSWQGNRFVIPDISWVTASLHNVPTADAERAWPLVRAHIERMAEGSLGEMTAEDFEARIASGHFQLWIVLEKDDLLATVLTEIVGYPQRKVCFIVGCVGEHRAKWIHLLAEIEDWARSQGCVTSRIRARKGWVKVLPDYKIAHIVLERAL